MADQLHSLRLLCLITISVLADPDPGRIPKVYNALITSNQNLEPSKAYPVYQPVLHDTFFPFQPAVFYGGEIPISNGIFPVPALIPKEQQPSQPPTASVPQPPAEPSPSSTVAPPSTPLPSPGNDDGKSTPAPPPPPNTQSPIPLNEFGLPSQVLPIGRVDPAYNGFTQIGPFTYSYPSVRFYDPYDPFSFNPYGGLPPLYRPLANALGQSAPVLADKELAVGPAVAPAAPSDQAAPTPPPEPSDLNVLNYSSKDPAIPNVPPPPLPQGGLKSDKSE